MEENLTTKNQHFHKPKMIKDGADFIDIGAQSTRPNAEFLSAEEEIRRLETSFL
jgi:dihydropteroate synthase